jgi:nitrate reductase NapA
MKIKRRDFFKVAIATGATFNLLLDPFKVLEDYFENNAFAEACGYKSVCRFCGAGCGVMVEVSNGKVSHVTGDLQNHNAGQICIKPMFLDQIINHPARLTRPLIRKANGFEEISWQAALDEIGKRFNDILDTSGPDSLAYYGSGQAFTEESYLANKLWKAGYGSNMVEANARLCMASAVVGHYRTFGKDEPPGCYEDMDYAKTFFLIGSNAAECHPVLWDRILYKRFGNSAFRRRKRDIKIIIADPRKTETAVEAEKTIGEENVLWLGFVPGSDVLLLNAMTYVILKENLFSQEFVEKYTSFVNEKGEKITFEDFKNFIEDFKPEKVASQCGVSPEDIIKAARWFAESPATMSCWTMGVNQQTKGVFINNCIFNLHLLTGQIGRPGATALSFTGQPNACGGIRDTGTLTHALPAGRLIKKEKHRREMEDLWGLEPGSINPKVGLHTINLFRAIEKDKIKGLLIQCTNPGQTLPNVGRYHKALKDKNCFVVAMEVFQDAKTLEFADIVLPVAFWVEKTGVFGNTQRQYQLVEKLVDPPGEAKEEIAVIQEIAKRTLPQSKFKKLFNYKNSQEIWDEWKRVAKDTSYNFEGITYDRMKRGRGLMWPCPDENHNGTKRRYVRGEDPLIDPKDPRKFVFYGKPDGKAVIFALNHKDRAELTNEEYPLVLSTGRVLGHFHTGTMTMKARELRKAWPKAYVEINPLDAKKLRIKNGRLVKVISPRGSLKLKAVISHETYPREGVVFVPFYDKERLINLLTIDAIDPLSKQPEYKGAACRIEKI